MIRAALLHAAAVATWSLALAVGSIAIASSRLGAPLAQLARRLDHAAHSATHAVPRHADHRGAGSAITADIHRRTR